MQAAGVRAVVISSAYDAVYRIRKFPSSHEFTTRRKEPLMMKYRVDEEDVRLQGVFVSR
jgi:hypothetical protein